MKETSKDESLKKPLINIKYCNVRKFIIMDITFIIIFCFVRLIAYYICIKLNGICLDIVRAVQFGMNGTTVEFIVLYIPYVF